MKKPKKVSIETQKDIYKLKIAKTSSQKSKPYNKDMQ